MQAQRLRDCIDQGKVRYGCRYDMAEVEFYEVPVPDERLIEGAAVFEENKEYDSEEEEKRCKEGEDLARPGCAFQLIFREIRDDSRRAC